MNDAIALTATLAARADGHTASQLTIDSAAVAAGATVLLVLLTGYYAWQTRATVSEMSRSRGVMGRTLDEMTAGRELAPMPTLVCTLEHDPERLKQWRDEQFLLLPHFTLGCTNVVVRNVRNAPALSIALRIEVTNPDRSDVEVTPTTHRAAALGLAEEWRPSFAPVGMRETSATTTPSPNPLEHPRLRVALSWLNAYNRRFAWEQHFKVVGTRDPDVWAWSPDDEPRITIEDAGRNRP